MKKVKTLRIFFLCALLALPLLSLAWAAAFLYASQTMAVRMLSVFPADMVEDALLAAGDTAAYAQGLATLREAGYAKTGIILLSEPLAPMLLSVILFTLLPFAMCLILLRRMETAVKKEGKEICACLEDERYPPEGDSPILREISESICARMKQYEVTFERLAHEKGRMNAFAQNVYHQIKTPISGLRIQLELLPESTEQNQCMKIVDQLSEKVSELLRLGQLEAKAVKMEMKKQPISAIISEAIDAIIPLAEERGLHIQCELPESITCPCHAFWLREAFENLLKNACEQIDTSGEVTISLRESETVVEVQIHSNSPYPEKGILLQKYATEKAGGTGLGVYIAAEVIAQHFGQLDFAPGRDGGTDTIVTLTKIQIPLPVSRG